jgi:hypothetical protein
MGGFCYESSPRYTIENTTEAKCCEEANIKGDGWIHGVNEWTFYSNNNTCHLLQIMDPSPPYSFGNCTSGVRNKLIPKPCDCERVHKSVGLEYLYQAYGKSQYSLDGGYWQSFPGEGQCESDDTTGDGCSYKFMGIKKAINATCMYATINNDISALNSTCFDKCPQPKNVTSTCYLQCFSETVAVAT